MVWTTYMALYILIYLFVLYLGYIIGFIPVWGFLESLFIGEAIQTCLKLPIPYQELKTIGNY